MDNTVPEQFLDKRTAVYRKVNLARQPHICEGCAGRIIVGEPYVRIQFVAQQPGENLKNGEEARDVEYSRRVVSKFHLNCEPTELS